ncbi:MAG TPA: carboxypeptidase regulatory-like domain-containing protein, partial [Vicinamibacterales bacterium]|nr:carboxypeptidase regulatory-like domain-containing protein [Vicinamibacterales bacterium]
MQRIVVSLVVATVFSIVPVAPLFAQGALSEINGTATDQSGAVLPGVTVTLTEETTGLVRTVVTNDAGRWVLPALQPGRYTIKAELSGFQTQNRAGVVVNVGQAITINLALPVGGLTDQVTVTGEAPLVEVTRSDVGTNITGQNIEALPTAGRQQYALLQLVPGLTPTLAAGSFEGAQYSAGGQSTSNNVFMVDGAYNNDDRTQSGPGMQTRMTIDTTAEYQVLVHDFGAEYGGAAGAVINAVTKGGSNEFHGRAAYYLQDSKLDATNYFLKLAGSEPAKSGVKTMLANIGGPIIKNKMFFFGNVERLRIRQAADLLYPANAAPLAVSYSTFLPVGSENYFGRLDYQINQSNNVSVRAVFDVNRVNGQDHVVQLRTIQAMRIERVPSPGETFINGQWLRVMGNRLVNEFRAHRVNENLQVGDQRMFDNVGSNTIYRDNQFLGLGKTDQFDFGSGQMHPDYLTGPYASPGGANVTTTLFTEQLTFTPAKHTLKFGVGGSKNGGVNVVGTNYIGLFTFAGNAAFDPANPSTYPNRFSIQLGELFRPMKDWRMNYYVSDKWQATNMLTLTLGIRYDYQHEVPQTKNAYAPRLGMALAPSDKLLIRAGAGKFYQYQSTAIPANLFAGAVNAPVFTFDTGQDNSASQGRFPTNVCLLPVNNGGQAEISAACRAQLDAQRSLVGTAGFVNTEPVLDGRRRLAYLWSYDVGVQRELVRGMAVTVDVVATRGYDQLGRIDINEPRRLANGTIGRPGPAVFDPDGKLIPASARNATFQRVLQYQSAPFFNSDSTALEVSLVRRMANRWSGRAAYTLSKARDVGTGVRGEARVVNDLDPRTDYGLSDFDNRHAFTAGGNWDPWRGLSTGATFRFYSGNPVNETIGLDANGDRDNTDRPIKGINDLTKPILSPVDANGVAVRNGIPGSHKTLLDLRLQYVVRLQNQRTAGFFWEVYNALNHVNFNNV